VNVTFHGAAREVTGSCHVLRVGESSVALDLGMFQGRRAEAQQKNLTLPFTPSELSAVILSHAHIDHSGRLPLLARHGFDRPVYATPATRDLCAIMLADSAHIQEKDAEFLAKRRREHAAPLYDQRDVARLMRKMISIPYDTPFDVAAGIRATFVEAGHILGSASVVLECREGNMSRRVVFSGDIGRWGLPIIRDPEPPQGRQMGLVEEPKTDEQGVEAGDVMALRREVPVRARAASRSAAPSRRSLPGWSGDACLRRRRRVAQQRHRAARRPDRKTL